MVFEVFIWKEITSEGAEIVETVEAPNFESAVQEVMFSHNLSRVYYAYVVLQDETTPYEDFYDMRCPGVRGAGH